MKTKCFMKLSFTSIALRLNKGNKGLFDYPLDVQYIYMDSLGEPINDFDRSYKQFLCQNFFVAKWKKTILDIISFFLIPFLIIFLFIKNLGVRYVHDVDAIEEDHHMEEVVPQILKEKYVINTKAWHSGLCLSYKDLSYIFKHIIGWRHPYFIFKTIIKIATYSACIKRYPPKAIIINGEYSFSSSILTNYCHTRNVKHINVMHGEKLCFIRDSFFHFDECYVWSHHYIDMFIRQKAEPSQFIIAVPESLSFDCNQYINPSTYADYKYYLAIYTEKEIKSIVHSLSYLKQKGNTIKYRIHPRYSDVNLLRKYVNEDEIEYPSKVSIFESISNMQYAIGSYTTVLLQAFFSKKGVILDDVTYLKRYYQLKDYGYFLSTMNVDRLSELIK